MEGVTMLAHRTLLFHKSVSRCPLLTCLLLLPVALVTGSTTYELEPGSVMVTGCIGPSLCDCAEELIGDLEGTFQMSFSGSMGSLDLYLVEGVDWRVNAGTPEEITITGGGTYSIDLAGGVHGLSLSLLVDGELQEFESVDLVPGGGDFPAAIPMQVFYPLDDWHCLFDGFYLTATAPQEPFRRGDCNVDEQLDIGDAITGLDSLFANAGPVLCTDACDSNDDGAFDISDIIYLLTNLFGQGPPPEPPSAECGPDPTLDVLGCVSFPPCP